MNLLDKLMREKRIYPKIICDDKELLSDIGCWLGTRSNIKNEFSKTLLSLGFKSDDEIVLYKYNKKTFSFSYILNGRNPYKKNTIWLNCGFDDGRPRLILTTGSRKTREMKVYRCSRDNKNRLNNNFEIVSEDKILSNGVNERFIYNNEDDNIEIEVVYPNDYSLNIEIERPYSGLLSDYEKYFNKDDRLKNEEQLINTLVWLELPLGIDKIYKEISDVFLKDISLFPRFVLKVDRYDNEKYLYELISKIEFRYGKFNKFIYTDNGKRITIDNNGNWQYEINNIVVDFNNGQLTYGIINNGKQVDSELSSLKLKDEAIIGVENVKKLVRTMSSSEGESYDR